MKRGKTEIKKMKSRCWQKWNKLCPAISGSSITRNLWIPNLQKCLLSLFKARLLPKLCRTPVFLEVAAYLFWWLEWLPSPLWLVKISLFFPFCNSVFFLLPTRKSWKHNASSLSTILNQTIHSLKKKIIYVKSPSIYFYFINSRPVLLFKCLQQKSSDLQKR